LKLANILAQYLYTNKRLDLPGIGTFFLDPSAITQAENSKQRSAISDGVRFEYNSSIQDTGDLIGYISAKTGKMKSLAISDLESYLELAKQFLNIGKPFTFEGIGNLMKLKPGEFEFSPGPIASEKLKDIPERETTASSKNDGEKYESFLSSPSKTSFRKPVILLLVLTGIGLAIWGGYIISSRNQENNNSVIESTVVHTMPATDTSQINKPAPDSAQKPVSKPDKDKYVLEIANAKRAFKRFNVLKENMWDVKMETTDSVQYKLFLLLPIRTDTTKVLDSLTVLSGRKVYLENRN
jgi:hypothetical protein